MIVLRKLLLRKNLLQIEQRIRKKRDSQKYLPCNELKNNILLLLYYFITSVTLLLPQCREKKYIAAKRVLCIWFI